MMKTRSTLLALLAVSLLIAAGCNNCSFGGSGGTPTQPTTGFLTVTVGFSAGSTTNCTGSTSVTISGPGGSKSSGILNFSGTGGQVDPNHFGCAVTATFPSLTPGTWTASASTGGGCAKAVTAGNSTSILIWETVCS